MKVVFKTPGIIDPASFSIFGTSIKLHENPIGQFGTGLKYAIAIILRTNSTIKIYTKNTIYEFFTEDIVLREKLFKQVCVKIIDRHTEYYEHKELPYTTELGQHWEVWQAFRELLCNTLDEKGCVEAVKAVETSLGKYDFPLYEKEDTKIVVEGASFLKAFSESSTIYLDPTKLKDSTLEGNILRKSSKYVFYRGIRILGLSKASLFTYNVVRNCQLTEDRTVSNQNALYIDINNLILSWKHPRDISSIVTASKGTFEHEIDFTYSSIGPSDEFLNTVSKLYQSKNASLNPSAIKVLFKHCKNFEELSETFLTSFESALLTKSIAFLERNNISIKDYPIKIMDTLGQNILGLVKNNTIYLAKECFTKGEDYLISTLLEEFIHLRYNYYDCSRALQTYLFDTIVKLYKEREFLSSSLNIPTTKNEVINES